MEEVSAEASTAHICTYDAKTPAVRHKQISFAENHVYPIGGLGDSGRVACQPVRVQRQVMRAGLTDRDASGGS